MGLVRNIVLRCVPKRLAADMEAESRAWKLRCPCGRETSFWDIGGIRYKTVSVGKRVLIGCPQCGLTWHSVYKSTEPVAKT